MIAVALTILAGVWRFADGRGYGKTWVRNLAGLLIALGCAYWGNRTADFSALLPWATYAISALVAWLTLVLGYTNWPSWWSLARYGAPACAIAAVGYVGGTPIVPCVLYGLSGILVGLQYPLLQSTGWKYATATSEVIAGAVIVGGLAWLA